MMTSRVSSFKPTVDAADGRRRREETILQIRKNKKEEQLSKRRGRNNGTTSSPTNISTEAQLVEHERKLAAVAAIPELTKQLICESSSRTDVIEATKAFRMLSEKNSLVDVVIGAGVIPIFVKNLDSKDRTLLYESVWALTNIAATHRTSEVVVGGAVPPLMALLRNYYPEIRETTAQCLGNIAGDENKQFRDSMLSNGIVDSLLLNLKEPATKHLLNHVVWCLSNLCRPGKGGPPNYSFLIPAIGPLVDLLHNEQLSAADYEDAVWALAYLAEGGDDLIQRIVESGVTKRLVLFLGEKIPPQLLKPSVRCLGNIATGSDCYAQAILDAGFLQHMLRLLESPKKQIVKEICWTASNIAGGTHDQIEALIRQRGVIDKITDYARTAPWETRKEALWTLCNCFTTGNDNHTMRLVQFESLQPIAEVLAIDNTDAKLLCASLEAIEQVLKVSARQNLTYERVLDEYNGIENLENLQEHQSDKVYNKTVEILERFFVAEEEEDQSLVPETSDDGTFGFGSVVPKQLFGAPVAVDHSRKVSVTPQPQFGRAMNRAF